MTLRTLCLRLTGVALPLALAAGPADGQTADTLAAGVPFVSVLSDTLTLPADTSAVLSPSGVDSVITYSSADSIVYSLSDRTMYLHGAGKIRYKELSLAAETIDIDWKRSQLTARGIPDSTDSTGVRGRPEMIDKGEVYNGSVVTYNFRTKKGRITLGDTEIDDGFYHGTAIKRVDDDVLFVGGGSYTTCELPHPHYYFGSPEMKITVKDEVVARPVYMYVSDVPVAALPWGVFPAKGGRRSGLIAPTYGTNQRGRYLRNLGYYWAMTDYTDINLRADGYTNGSWVLHSDFRYALRYNFTGSITGSYGNTFTGEPGDPAFTEEDVFNIRLGHHQDLDPTSSLDVDFTFTSDNYYQNTSVDFNELLRQQIISNATYQKRWEGTPHSMTLNLNRTQDLQTGSISQILPGFVFNRTQSYPFRPSSRSTPQEWYDYLGFSYTGQFRNENSKTVSPTTGETDRVERLGAQHSVPLNAASRIGYFNITPFFNYTEKWYNRATLQALNPADSTIASTEEKGFKAVRYFDTGISLGTRLFGILQPGILGITGVRHQFSPSVSYTYSPDWSDPKFGYYGTRRDLSGNEIKYNLYQNEVFGGAPQGERQSIGLRIGNIFEMKTAATDTASEENKFQLLNLDVSTAYNIAADSLKFSEINLGYRTQVGSLLDIAGSSRFNLYKFDQAAGKRVDRFLISEEGRLAQLTSFNISVSTKLSGDKISSKSGPKKDEADSLQQTGSGYLGLYEEKEPDFSIPWQLDLTWNFSQNQSNPSFVSKSSNVNASISFNLTEFWKIRASTSYDLLNKKVAAPQISVYRDLHCWEMNFNWVPTGSNQHYQLEIRLKSPFLQDVKVTKQESSSGVF